MMMMMMNPTVVWRLLCEEP